MNNIKTSFSIKDLENLSGIKAHTIRIWEKRYNLLQPERTDTNIRLYDLNNLQKLLNVSFLNNNGVKISHIAKLKPEEIAIKVKEFANSEDINSHLVNSFKLSMMNFDPLLFHKTYSEAVEQLGFEKVFNEIIWQLLNEIGILWQTDTINPAHEHFISYLVRQKLLVEIEKFNFQNSSDREVTFVLFLPMHEIHELGLMYINYILHSKGYQPIYLGPSVPRENLLDLVKYYKSITFISYFTIEPEHEKISDFISDFHSKLLKGKENQLWLLGNRTKEQVAENLPDQVTTFNSLHSISGALDQMSQLSSTAV